MSATCQSCHQTKAELFVKKSKLNGMQLLMCNICISAKFEPRWIIILHGRSHGIASVSDYVQKHKYVGSEIEAKSFLT